MDSDSPIEINTTKRKKYTLNNRAPLWGFFIDLLFQNHFI